MIQVLADHLFRESREEESRFTVHLQVTGEYKGGEGKVHHLRPETRGPRPETRNPKP